MSVSKFPKGSVWRKWDLHIHTPASPCYESNDTNWIHRFMEALSSSDTMVFAITDHFTLDGYNELLKYKHKIDKVIFPGIELRLEDTILPSRHHNQGRKSARPINIQIVFDNNDNLLPKIEEFIRSLQFKDFDGNKNDLTKENIILLGKRIDLDSPNKEFFQKGCEQIRISKDQIEDRLKDKGLRDNALIILPYEKYGGISKIDPDSDSLIKSRLTKIADIIESSKEEERNFFLGKSYKLPFKLEDRTKNQKFKDFIGKPKPCVTGSDSHNLDTIGKFPNQKCCWIKANPTFEGLKQIIYEPEERVRVQKESPEPHKNIFSMKSARINNIKISDELTFPDTCIEFNQNFVAIIGGRGSGKTAIVDLIANCYTDYDRSLHLDSKGNPTRHQESVDKNSFVQRIEKDSQELIIELSYLKGETFTKKITETSFFQSGKIRYFPQGKIEQIAGNTKELHKTIQELIFTSDKIKDSDLLIQYNNNKEEINTLRKDLKQLSQQILELEEETKVESAQELRKIKKEKDGELENKESDLKDYASQLTEDEQKRISGIHDEIQKLKNRIEALEKLKLDIRTLKNEKVEIHLKEINDEIKAINRNIRKIDYLKLKELPEIIYESITSSIGYNIERITNTLINLNDTRNQKNKKIEEYSETQKQQARLLKDKSDIEKELTLIESSLKEIEKKKEIIEKKKAERDQKMIDLIQAYKNEQSAYNKLIEEYKKDEIEILKNIEFKADIRFGKEKFLDLGKSVLDNRKISEENIEKLGEKLESITATEELEKNYQLINDLLSHFKGNYVRYKTNMDFYNWIFNDYYSLSTNVLFNGVELSKLSIGEKGTVILKLYLAEGDYPMILDQPDDNLDNKFIADEVVNVFREAKKKRQIVLTTHNANLVVNTDAEQIIVAEFKDNKISYTAGAIEDTDIRKEITTILEGGEDAFKKREDKYGF